MFVPRFITVPALNLKTMREGWFYIEAGRTIGTVGPLKMFHKLLN